jgi:hypothetical protein
MYHRDYALENVKLESITHSSVKLLKTEILVGIGPSKPLAWISLLRTQFQWIQITPGNFR